MIKLIICGANGKVGQVLADAAAKTDGMTVIAGVDKFPNACKNDFPVYERIADCPEKADAIIDFSRPEALSANLTYATQSNTPIVIATTGFSEQEKEQICKASKNVPIFFSANMSLGVNLQMELAKKAAEFLGEAYDIEIIEKHHNQKVDSPSGTALAIAEYINGAFEDKKCFIYGRHSRTEKRGREIGIHGVRGGTITGEHNVMFIGTDEIIEVNHIAQSKYIFAFGSLRAASFLVDQPAGLYNMNDLIAPRAVSSIYQNDNQAVITVNKMPSTPSVIAEMFDDIASNGINLDIISQTAPQNGSVSLSVSMNQSDLQKCNDIIMKHLPDASTLSVNEDLSKLTIEGARMHHQTGVASKLFSALSSQDIDVYIVTTSEAKISFCVDTNQAKGAFGAISDAFTL